VTDQKQKPKATARQIKNKKKSAEDLATPSQQRMFRKDKKSGSPRKTSPKKVSRSPSPPTNKLGFDPLPPSPDIKKAKAEVYHEGQLL
jgi:hypothetical protein